MHKILDNLANLIFSKTIFLMRNFYFRTRGLFTPIQLGFLKNLREENYFFLPFSFFYVELFLWYHNQRYTLCHWDIKRSIVRNDSIKYTPPTTIKSDSPQFFFLSRSWKQKKFLVPSPQKPPLRCHFPHNLRRNPWTAPQPKIV